MNGKRFTAREYKQAGDAFMKIARFDKPKMDPSLLADVFGPGPWDDLFERGAQHGA